MKSVYHSPGFDCFSSKCQASSYVRLVLLFQATCVGGVLEFGGGLLKVVLS
jgi:hypothetical protein